MSTRACIARVLFRQPIRFAGIIVESDGKPTEMGPEFLALARSARTPEFALIDAHAAGWESLRQGMCLCGGRERGARLWGPIDEETGLGVVEFVYAFDDEEETVVVLAAAKTGWRVLWEGPLGGADPDWAAIERSES